MLADMFQAARRRHVPTLEARSEAAKFDIISVGAHTAVTTALTERRAELKSAELVRVEGSSRRPARFPTPDRARS
jgi:hypothetical protein